VNRQSRFVLSILAFGYAFLYVPLLLVVVYSFNNSRIATVWGGFSTRWYGELLRNEQILDAAFLSLRIAFTSATIATVLGTMAGLALARFRRFKGRTLFSGMITSPMVMPEVITGLSLLLLFVALQQLTGWPGQRGFGTITIAHTTFAMAYVAVIVQSRLMAMDESLEEAAMDLGGRPLRVVFDITLPLIAPAMVAGWLLAFTLSLDELGHPKPRVRSWQQHTANVHLLESETGRITRHQRTRDADHRIRKRWGFSRLAGDA